MTALPRRFLRAALVPCALLVSACAPGRTASAGAAPERATTLEPRAWTAQSPASEIAAWVQAGCRRAAGGADPCVERALTALLDQAGVAKSMEVLDTLALRDGGVRNDAHALAHGLGIYAYRGSETLAATFSACPNSQMSGCYHGVIQGYFLDLGRRGQPVGAAEMDALCAPHASQQFIWFQCAHGLGHGLMALHQNHLPTALASCDLVTSVFVRESCYGGAFMENAMQAQHPHHTAAGHAETQEGVGSHAAADEHAGHGGAGEDAHAGHGAGAMAHGEWRALDPADLLYPCNAVETKYQDACYGFQPSPIMFFNNGDIEATARECDRVPEAFRITCFSSLGREITAWAAQEHSRTLALCGRVGDAGGGRGRVWCEGGAVATLMNQSADPQDGVRFCRAVQGVEGKRTCYNRVGSFVVTIFADREERARHCAAAEPEFIAICRRAAEVDPPTHQAGP
ncbi:MAG TPA: hypothetical protein VFT45_27905 [Longimicrobium sp.]|nr:hypothetical protein [Longimicrobium sp.]